MKKTDSIRASHIPEKDKNENILKVGTLCKDISSIAEIIKNQVKHLPIEHSGVPRLFLKFAGKVVGVLNILLAK